MVLKNQVNLIIIITVSVYNNQIGQGMRKDRQAGPRCWLFNVKPLCIRERSLNVKDKKDDRRVRYTKRVIRESFVRLMEHKPISRITVKEICELADVNRSTFYAHYASPDDLMQKIKEEVLQEINSWMDGIIAPMDGSGAHRMMTLVFEYAAANAALCKVLLGQHGDEPLQEEIMMIAQAQVMKEWPGNAEAGAGLMEYLIQFGVHAGVAVVKKWLENGLREPPEEMAGLVIRLIYHGLYSAIPKRPMPE